jgi:hypothetical protein
VFWLRGNTTAGRAFAYFAGCAAIVNTLIFDLWTTHNGTPAWTFAVASLGGAIFGLSVLIPRPIPSVIGRYWIRVVAYSLSIFLAVWGGLTIYNLDQPWAYVIPWQLSYLYASFGLAIFVISMLARLRMDLPPQMLQQVRIILWGGVLAFTPVGVWLAIQIVFDTPFDPLLLSLVLLIFPVTIAFAMLRYRMWDIDLVLRRTVIYTLLTGLLVAIYLILVLGAASTLNRFWGRGNLFNVLATLVVVVSFAPLRKAVQRFVDRRFYRQRFQTERIMKQFEGTLREQMDIDDLSSDLARVVNDTIRPEFIIFWIPKQTRKNKN